MTKGQRASQIWPVLTLCASRRLTLTYDELGRLIGVPRQGLGQLLEPIQSFCILHGLPALSSLVVSENSGLPGEGFIAAEHVPGAQAAVFDFRWLETPPADENELVEAWRRLPSNGRRLEDLLGEADSVGESRRNVPWARSELVLVLDLYQRHGALPPRNELVRELSAELRRMGSDNVRYHVGHRSPDAVAMQLKRFGGVAAGSGMKGRDRGGPETQRVWDEFNGDLTRVAAEAATIRRGLSR